MTRQASQGRAGMTLAVVSAATFGTSGTFATSLIDAGWSPGAAVLARIAVAALILTVPGIMALRGRWGQLRRSLGRVAGYGLFAVAGAQLCYFNAIQRIPIGVALLLEYLGVVLVVGWMWLRHAQRPGRVTVAGAVVALAGLGLVLDLSGSARLSLLGVMWGLLAAVGLAAYFVLSASAGGDALPPIVMAWAGMCAGAALLGVLGLTGVLPMRASTADVQFLHHQVSWIVPVAGLALVAAVIPYVTGIGAARRLGARLSSFVGMAEVLFAVLFAWLLLGQLPTALQFGGGALILAGVALVRLAELRAPAAPRAGPRPDADRADALARS
ncbi:MAG TPA: EamA family transporter [Streptosporangiaceae bacterium]|nr:EamA family transporter [Streptosporangiaceae bacterium]